MRNRHDETREADSVLDLDRDVDDRAELACQCAGETIASIFEEADRIGINIHREIAYTVDDRANVWLYQGRYGFEGCASIELPVPAGATSSTAHDISDEGFIAGSVTVANGDQHAFVWQLGFPQLGSITFADLADEIIFPTSNVIDRPTVAWSVNDETPPWVTGQAEGFWNCGCPTPPFSHNTTLGYSSRPLATARDD